jgi:hypothetical protein
MRSSADPQQAVIHPGEVASFAAFFTGFHERESSIAARFRARSGSRTSASGSTISITVETD